MTKYFKIFKSLFLIFLLLFLVSCIEIKYTLTIDANGGLIDGKSIQQIHKNSLEEEKIVTLGTPIKEGYEFVGWVRDGVILSKNEIVIDSNITVIAKYDILEYKITYNLNGGTLDKLIDTYTVEDEIDLGKPSKIGYEFIGWNEGFTKISKGTTGDLLLEAKYSVKEYNIQYELNGGKFENDVVSKFTFFDEVILPTPVKDGVEFEGWYENVDFTNKVQKIYVGTAEDKVLYAKWSGEVVLHNIQYELNGGQLPEGAPTSFAEGNTFVLPTPTKEGYEFVGWYLNADLSGNIKNNISSTDNTDIKLYAKWNETTDTYSIKYNLNGGTLEEGYIEKYTFGDNVQLPIPTKDNSIFMGWYVDSNFDGDVVTKITSSDKGDKVYYALWMEIKDVFNSVIPNPVTSNLNLYSTHPDNSDIKLSWTSGNTKLITNTGVINQAHKTLTTTLTMTMTYKGVTSSYTGDVKLAPVVYDDLTMGNTVVGYVYSGTLSRWGSNSFNNIFSSTALSTLDVVNYGFATVDANGNLLLDNTGYTKYLEEVLKLRQQGIRVLLCIGENSKNFSDMTYDTDKMNKFVEQVVNVVEQYHFDGVDIDWEFPGVNTGRDTSVDRANYTKLIKALRSELDKVQEDGGTKYLLTAAIPGTSWGSERYEMNILDNYLDYVNMMSYDLNNTKIACHHSSLYTSSTAKAYGFSIQYGINRFVSLGFNKKQIVVGMAFYGKYYNNATALGKNATFVKNIHYTVIDKEYLGGGDYQQLWDDVAKAPYILNTVTGEYISYDNARSITEKCKYSKSSGIMGVMFWDYSEDITGDLMKAIHDEMK